MTLAAIEQQIDSLTPDEQDRLASILLLKRLSRDPQFARDVAESFADDDPESWLPLDELKRRLDVE